MESKEYLKKLILEFEDHQIIKMLLKYWKMHQNIQMKFIDMLIDLKQMILLLI